MDRREERIQNKRKKLKNSEIMDALRDEFGMAPEAASNSGVSGMNADQKLLKEEAEERRRFEEERFVRLVSAHIRPIMHAYKYTHIHITYAPIYIYHECCLIM
jgi:Skp family chaperone for outer membrane proteins